MAESYIHTKEAFKVYWEHLTEHGTIVMIFAEEALFMKALLTG